MEVSHVIAPVGARREPHGTGKTLVKPCILCAAKIVFGKSTEDTLKKIFLSSHSVKYQIDVLTQDIELQNQEQIK
jgi:hypothetical protein